MKKFFEKIILVYRKMFSRGGSEVDFWSNSYHQITSEIWESCAKLYCQIWREPPWNEDFWREGEVLVDIERELKKPGAKFFLAVRNRLVIPVTHGLDIYSIQVVGFTWGYLINREDAREISQGSLLDDLFNEEETIFYTDELAVSSSVRNKKIGEKLSALLIESVKKAGSKKIVLRTDKKAVAAKKLYTKMGFIDLDIVDFVYPDRTYWILKL